MSNDVKTDEKPARATHALILELEYVAAKKRKVEFDAIQGAVKTKGVELTPVLFSRSGMSPLSRSAITSVLKQAGKKSDAIEKAVAEVDKKVLAYCTNDAELDAGVLKLIKATKKQGIPVLAFTALPENVAKILMDKLGLTDLGVELIIPDEVKESFPRADSWLKMLKKCDKEDATLIAVVSSQIACKGALTAGAACIAVPDEFTEFQDFSGAKMLLDSLSNARPQEILDLTLRM
jgi:beta-phosphoglucomutase-like phosphatase (HAD superfamily)